MSKPFTQSRVFTAVDDFIFKIPIYWFVSIILIILFIKSGININSYIIYQFSIVQNPFMNQHTAKFLQYSWLAPYLAWLLHIKSPYHLFLFYLFFNYLFFILFICLLFHRLADREARIAAVIFTTLPISSTIFYFVCYDSLTLFLMCLALYLTHPQWIFRVGLIFVGFLLGIQHFEQSFIAIFLVLIVFLQPTQQNQYDSLWAIALLVGIISGKIFLSTIFHIFNIYPPSTRLSWLNENLSIYLRAFCFNLQYILWSILGPSWLLVFKSLDKGRKVIPFIISLFIIIAILAVTYDETRIAAILSFWLLSVYWLLNQYFLKNLDKQLVTFIFLFWLISPMAWVIGGVAARSVFFYNLYHFIDFSH